MRIFKRTGRSPQSFVPPSLASPPWRSGSESEAAAGSCCDRSQAMRSVGHLNRPDGCGSRRKAGASSSFFDLLSEELDIAHNLFRWGGVDFSTKGRRLASAESVSRLRRAVADPPSCAASCLQQDKARIVDSPGWRWIQRSSTRNACAGGTLHRSTATATRTARPVKRR